MPPEELPPTPSPPPEPLPHRKRRVAVGGIVLVLLGLFFLLSNFFPGERGSSFLLLVGVAFLAGYLLGGRNARFLIPGGIVSGLGLGVYLENWLPRSESGGVVLLGLGLGFVAIWLLERGQRWALIAGGVLAAIGALALSGQLVRWDVGTWWPAVLVLVGLWLLFRRAWAAGRKD